MPPNTAAAQAARLTTVQVDLPQLQPLSIKERYEHKMGIITLMDKAGVKPRERLHIIEDGFESIKTLIEHYANDMKGFKAYLESLNKTFASARTASDKVYFTPPVLS
jgi:hypothetical protein